MEGGKGLEMLDFLMYCQINEGSGCFLDAPIAQNETDKRKRLFLHSNE